jgi:hypothetical protein
MSSATSGPGPHSRDRDTAAGGRHGSAEDTRIERRDDRSFKDVVSRQKEEFGGIKFGSAFFGWLTATGTTVILLALVAAVATAVGAELGLTPQTATDTAEQVGATQVGLVSGIVVAVVLFLGYFCGGYVAGRMARFNGLKQGLAVWLWAVIMIVVIAIIGAIVGSSSDLLRQVSFPQIPTTREQLTTGSIIALAILLGAALLGALLGGLAGMRFHRRVDKAGYEPRV